MPPPSNEGMNCRHGKVGAGSVHLEGPEAEYRFLFVPETKGEPLIWIKGEKVAAAADNHSGMFVDDAIVTLVFDGSYSDLSKMTSVVPGKVWPVPI